MAGGGGGKQAGAENSLHFTHVLQFAIPYLPGMSYTLVHLACIILQTLIPAAYEKDATVFFFFF